MPPTSLLLLVAVVNACTKTKVITSTDIINHMKLIFEQGSVVQLWTGEFLEIMLEEPLKSNCSKDDSRWIRCRCEANFIRLSVQENLHNFVHWWNGDLEAEASELVANIRIGLDNWDVFIDYHTAWKKIYDEENDLFIEYFFNYIRIHCPEATLN